MPDYLASHLLVDQLAAEGTKYIFGSLSSANSPIISAALDGSSEIQYLPGPTRRVGGSDGHRLRTSVRPPGRSLLARRNRTY